MRVPFGVFFEFEFLKRFKQWLHGEVKVRIHVSILGKRF